MYNKYAELRRRFLCAQKSGIHIGMLLTDKLDTQEQVAASKSR